MGASLVLFAIAFNLRAAIQRMGERVIMLLAALGVGIYAGVGILSMLLEKNYLVLKI